MRYILAALVIISMGCGTFGPLVTRDSHAKQHKFEAPTPEVRIRLSVPYNTCTTEKTLDGVPYARVMIFIHLIEMEAAPVTVIINRSDGVTFPDGNSFSVDYKAGIGDHYIEIFVGEDEPRMKHLQVSNCINK